MARSNSSASSTWTAIFLPKGAPKAIVDKLNEVTHATMETPVIKSRMLEIGVTGVDWALAETGTLVLVSGRGRPRSTSLLPATHVAVFGRDRLVESLEQVGVMLEALHVNPALSMSGAVIRLPFEASGFAPRTSR